MEQKICPNCQNTLLIDKQRSLTYCKNKICNGLIFEMGHITYEQEVNIHENEEKTKATRFGGYESKKDSFVTFLLEQLSNLDNKGRERIQKKFEAGEHLIHRLSQQFGINESTTKEIIKKFRELILSHIDKIKKKSFEQIAVVAFTIITQEKRKSEWLNHKKLNSLTVEIICDFANVDVQKISIMAKELGINHEKQYSMMEHQQQLISTAKDFQFSQSELDAMKNMVKSIMSSSIIGGEKQTTINSIIMLCVAQLSGNTYTNLITADQIASRNGVTKDTVKKMWNRLINEKIDSFIQLVPEWTGRKQLLDLKIIS